MTTSRKRGFATWNPHGKTRKLLDTIKAILVAYEAAGLLPITLRQLFYRLVARHAYPKTERDYNNLKEIVGKARRAQMVAMNALRDDGFHMEVEWWFRDVRDFGRNVTRWAETYRVDRQWGQSRRLLVWCEAAGMVPQLESVVRDYCIQVASSGGFDSITVKHAIGKRLADEQTTVLYIGDWDPSGEHMFGSLDEDVNAFAEHYGGDVEFVRIAVLEEHVAQYVLPTAPAKPTDNRSFSGTATVQAESLDPADLAGILRSEVQARLDADLYAKAMKREKRARQAIARKLKTGGLWFPEDD